MCIVICDGLMDEITRENIIVIKALWVQKNWSSRCFLKEFLSKAWCRQSFDRLIKKLMLDCLSMNSLVAVVAGKYGVQQC